MGEHSPEEIAKHVRIYIAVFVALLVLTCVTVAVSWLRLSVGMAILVAMLIASVKGSLVACFFMHLISEKKLIYSVLILTVVFFAFLMLVPTMNMQDSVGEPM